MSSRVEAEAKRELVKTMLAKNKLTPPGEIMEAVQTQFKSGIARTEISQLREELYGIKLGPGGIVLNGGSKRKARNVVRAKAHASNETAAVGTSDRLQKLVAQVREEMRSLQLSALSIPADGQVRAIATVQVEKTFDV